MLDTNVLISAFGWNGTPRNIVLATLEGKYELITTTEQLTEIQRALSYPKLKLTNKQQQNILEVIKHAATIVQPKTSVYVIQEDPDDNKILEAAIAGKATTIISGDKHVLQLQTYKNIPIQKPREFYEKNK